MPQMLKCLVSYKLPIFLAVFSLFGHYWTTFGHLWPFWAALCKKSWLILGKSKRMWRKFIGECLGKSLTLVTCSCRCSLRRKGAPGGWRTLAPRSTAKSYSISSKKSPCTPKRKSRCFWPTVISFERLMLLQRNKFAMIKSFAFPPFFASASSLSLTPHYSSPQSFLFSRRNPPNNCIPFPFYLQKFDLLLKAEEWQRKWQLTIWVVPSFLQGFLASAHLLNQPPNQQPQDEHQSFSHTAFFICTHIHTHLYVYITICIYIIIYYIY